MGNTRYLFHNIAITGELAAALTHRAERHRHVERDEVTKRYRLSIARFALGTTERTAPSASGRRGFPDVHRQVTHTSVALRAFGRGPVIVEHDPRGIGI